MTIQKLYVVGGFLKYQLKVIIALFCLLTAACGGQSGGFAPVTSPFITETIIDISAQSNFKFGETNNSTNSWEMSIDTTDPVEEVLLANGWNVEVKFE